MAVAPSLRGLTTHTRSRFRSAIGGLTTSRLQNIVHRLFATYGTRRRGQGDFAGRGTHVERVLAEGVRGHRVLTGANLTRIVFSGDKKDTIFQDGGGIKGKAGSGTASVVQRIRRIW